MNSGARVAMALVLTGSLLSFDACDVNKGSNVSASASSLPLQTICLGRYVAAIPLELGLRGDVELVYGLDKNFRTVKVEVLRSDGDVATFESAVAAQLAELTRSFDADTPSKNMLAKQHRVNKDTVLVLEHREPTMLGYYRVLVIARIGGAIALFKADVFKQNKPEEVESGVLAVAERTRYMSDPQQQGKGTCIGPLIIDAGQDGERFNVGAKGVAHADLSLSFSINSMLTETDGGLLKRVGNKAGVLTKLGAMSSMVRRGSTNLAGRRAEELVDEDSEEGKAVRLFVAETLLTAPSTLSEPRVHVEMSLGGRIKAGENKSEYVNPSLSKAESLAVWDAIIKSIRLRPGSV